MIQNPKNVLLVSMAGLWEMQIKLQLGKLKLNTPLEELVKGQLEINMIDILDIKLEHILALGKTPSHHKDPLNNPLKSRTNASADPWKSGGFGGGRWRAVELVVSTNIPSHGMEKVVKQRGLLLTTECWRSDRN